MKIGDVIKTALGGGGFMKPGGAIGGILMAGHERRERKKEVKSAIKKALEEETKRHIEGHKQRSEHKGY